MNKKLEKIVKAAYENTVFYRSIYKTILENNKIKELDFELLPIITKEDIYDNQLRILSQKVHKDYVNSLLIKHTTSGSTGVCMDIYWSEKNNNNSLLSLWYLRKKYYNINTDDLVCMFYANRTIKNYEPKQMKIGNCLSFSKSNLDKKRIFEIYLKICEFKPAYMIIEPSIAILLCDYIDSHHLEKIKSIKYIELTGEFLLPNVRKRIERTFDCITANQYGAYEVNSIAYECPEGNMHIMNNNVFVEIIDKNNNVVRDGKEGEVCVTSLTNYTMPFIRYKIGDYGKICVDKKCKCGNNAPILEIVNGRSNDYILCKNGERIHSSVFTKVIEKINIKLGNIIVQYQIHQLDYYDFLFKLVLLEDIEIQDLIEAFVESFDEKRLFEINVSFEFYDEIFPDDNTGKLYYFINDMKKEN